MANTEAQIIGSVELQVDEHGLVATLTITRDADGTAWSADSIHAFLKRRGVIEPLDGAEMRRRIEAADKNDEPVVAIVVAQGLAAETATSERAEFAGIAVPEEMADEAERVLAAAANPEIVVKRTRKVQRSKLQTVKPKLPFMRPRQERVMVTETETVPERVYVDPVVEQTAYVEAGQRIGRIVPRTAGAPGRSVYGKVIHPRPSADPLFYCGSGVQRRGEELVADTTGFLRVGANWTDVVSYAAHSWQVVRSEDQVSCFVDFFPGNAEARLPDARELIGQAQQLGFQTDQLISAELLAQQLAVAARRGAADRIPMTGSRDAAYSIHITEDRLTALLNLSKGKGRGKPLVLKEVGRAIRSRGLVRLDQAQIQQDVLAFYRSSEVDLIGYVLAEGTAPGEGPPRDPEFSFRPLPETQQRDLLRAAAEDPRVLEGIDSLDTFPMNAVRQMALVDREQRVVTIPPTVEGSPGSDVFGKPIRGATTPEPSLRLFENLSQTGSVVIAQIDGVLDCGEVDGVTMLRVRPHADADVGVTVSPDRMKAYLSLLDGRGSGRRVDQDIVADALARHNVRHGIRHGVLKAAVRAVTGGRRITNLLIAEGTPPGRSAGKTFELLVQPAGGSAVTIRDDGGADYKNQGNIRTVTAGTRLARILPHHAEARHGTDVTGAALPPAPQPEAEPQIGAFVRTERQPDGTLLLVAERDGDFVMQDNRLEIRVEYRVEGNVDFATGNIRFPGSVNVSGSVTGGFVVIAGGDITVGETVEASLLSADGRIVVRQGIKGAGKGVLRSRSAIGTGFAEQAALLSVGDISVASAALHCTVKTNGRLVVNGDRGAITGGSVRARHGVTAANLGSPNGVRTSISFGQDYLIADQIEKQEKEIETIKRRVTAVDQSMRGSGLTPDQIDELRREKKRLLKAMEKRSLRLFTLRERFEEHHDAAVTVPGTVHPGVTLESHGRTIDIRTPRRSVSFNFDELTGRVIEQPIDKRDA
ncbi:MAG: DUF342 domain-containing protein [Spirochaetaceae bacterium]|nr:MAG: DUF342 domain-containing protein [Spirochaetaceae bacterium]